MEMKNTYQYLETIVSTSIDYCEDLLGVRPSANLQLLDANDWLCMQQQLLFPESTQGMYSVDTDTAYVKLNSPYLESIIFHEFFGHASYHKRPQKKPGLTYNLDSEGFALWMEQHLCSIHGFDTQYKQRADDMSIVEKDLLDLFVYSEQQITTKGFLAQLGFDISFTQQDVSKILCAAYGLKAPTSFEYSQNQKLEVQLTNNLSPISSHWIDIYCT